jgi:hypothetical protein
MDKLLPGIASERVNTGRLTVAMLSVTERDGPAVLFVHGNVSPGPCSTATPRRAGDTGKW